MNRTAANREQRQRVECPVCGRVELLDVERPYFAEEVLQEMGWQWSSQISDKEHEWHLVCPRHYRCPGSRTILNDAENDPTRVNLPLISRDDRPNK